MQPAQQVPPAASAAHCQVATLRLFPNGKMVDGPKPTTIWLAPSNLCGDISIVKSRRGECQISTAHRRSLIARSKLRAASQVINKELSNFIQASRHVAVTRNQCGIRFIQRHQPFDVTSICALYEESLQIIWFFRWFV